MQSDTTNMKNMAMGFIAVVIVGLMAACCLADSVSAADPEYDEDLGSIWSMTGRFIYTGAGADTVTWDFGDGSSTVEGFNVDHTFAATGTYIVTQTSTNIIGSTVAKYRIEVLGYPTVTYDLGHDDLKIVLTQSAYNVVPATIADPTREGFTFAGWYVDKGCSVRADLTDKVDSPITLYAKWSSAGSSDPADDETPAEGLEDKDIATISLAAVGVIALAGALYTRRPLFALVAIVLLVAAGVLYTEVIEWPL